MAPDAFYSDSNSGLEIQCRTPFSHSLPSGARLVAQGEDGPRNRRGDYATRVNEHLSMVNTAQGETKTLTAVSSGILFSFFSH